MLDVNTHDATFFFPFINFAAFENLSPENLAWIKMHVARVVIPSHREGKQIAQNMLKVACYHLCVTVCSSTETSRNQQTSDANECSGAAQKTVEEAPAMAVLAAI